MLQKRKYRQLNKIIHPCSGIRIKFATTSSEFTQAMQLIHKVYTEKGLISDSERQSYFSPHIILPNNRLIVAIKDKSVIGTISLIENSPIGVPMDNVHPNETTALRLQGNKFAEVGSFAIATEYQHHGITMLLYRAVFLYVCLHRSIESILIAVHPRISGIYKSLFSFEKIGEEQAYSTLNNAKSVPLKANTADAISYINQNNMFNSDNDGLAIDCLLTPRDDVRFPSEADDSDNAINYLPVWRDAHIQNYFNECRITVKNLPEKQRAIISWLYPTLS